jgi:3-oxoacyl-[acyl-carrier-protein] synthase II
MVASHISIAHDARGPNNTICQSEASSLLALVESIDLLERGKVDAVICGGTGSPLTVTAMVYRGAWKLSQRVDQPATALRPFDVSRDGMVMGEGAGAFLLERTSDARRRGASILARLVCYARGFCLPTDGRFVECLTEMLRGASRAAGWAAHDVGHVNAHGASTQDDDAREAQAISAALNNVPVIAPKANVGNLGSGAGAVELAASVLALHHRRLPPVANTSVVDPQCPVNVVRAVTPLEQPTGLKLNFTDHGQIVVVGLAAAE